MSSRALRIVTWITLAARPRSNADICLAFSKATDPFLEILVLLGRPNADDMAFMVKGDEAFNLVLVGLRRLRPSSIGILHEMRSPFACGGVVDLLDSDVTSCSDDHAGVDGVVACDYELTSMYLGISGGVT